MAVLIRSEFIIDKIKTIRDDEVVRLLNGRFTVKYVLNCYVNMSNVHVADAVISVGDDLVEPAVRRASGLWPDATFVSHDMELINILEAEFNVKLPCVVNSDTKYYTTHEIEHDDKLDMNTYKKINTPVLTNRKCSLLIDIIKDKITVKAIIVK